MASARGSILVIVKPRKPRLFQQTPENADMALDVMGYLYWTTPRDIYWTTGPIYHRWYNIDSGMLTDHILYNILSNILNKSNTVGLQLSWEVLFTACRLSLDDALQTRHIST